MEFKNLKRVALSELRKLDQAYAGKDEFSEGDAKKYDCLMHGLKCQLTSEGMLEAMEGNEEDYNMSGRRMRSSYGQQNANYSGHGYDYPPEYYSGWMPPRRWGY